MCPHQLLHSLLLADSSLMCFSDSQMQLLKSLCDADTAYKQKQTRASQPRRTHRNVPDGRPITQQSSSTLLVTRARQVAEGLIACLAAEGNIPPPLHPTMPLIRFHC